MITDYNKNGNAKQFFSIRSIGDEGLFQSHRDAGYWIKLPILDP
jgi:hypothetical protein